MRSTSPRSYSLGTTGRQPACPHPLHRPVRLLHETTSSSKPAFSVAPSECTEPSSSMRTARSFRAISWVYMRPLRRSDQPFRDASRQPEASEGDRDQAASPDRGPVVAVLPDSAPAGAFRGEPHADLARSRRCPGVRGRSWQRTAAFQEILERSSEGEEGSSGRLLLLEWRTAAGPKRTAVGGDGRNRAGVRRSRHRLLDDAFGAPAR